MHCVIIKLISLLQILDFVPSKKKCYLKNRIRPQKKLIIYFVKRMGLLSIFEGKNLFFQKILKSINKIY
jgi:hypothetical protein